MFFHYYDLSKHKRMDKVQAVVSLFQFVVLMAAGGCISSANGSCYSFAYSECRVFDRENEREKKILQTITVIFSVSDSIIL